MADASTVTRSSALSPGEEGALQTGKDMYDYLSREYAGRRQALMERQREYEALSTTLDHLLSRTRHEVLAPVAGGLGYFACELQQTNMLTVLLGDGWFVERTVGQAKEIVDRRLLFLHDEAKAWEEEAAQLAVKKHLLRTTEEEEEAEREAAFARAKWIADGHADGKATHAMGEGDERRTAPSPHPLPPPLAPATGGAPSLHVGPTAVAHPTGPHPNPSSHVVPCALDVAPPLATHRLPDADTEEERGVGQWEDHASTPPRVPPPTAAAASSRSSTPTNRSGRPLPTYQTITPEDLHLLSRLSGKSIDALSTIEEEDELSEGELMALEEQLYAKATSEAGGKDRTKQDKEATSNDVAGGHPPRHSRAEENRTNEEEEEVPFSIETLLDDDVYMEKVLLEAVMAKKEKRLLGELTRLLKEREALGKTAISTLTIEQETEMNALFPSRPPQKERPKKTDPQEDGEAKNDGPAPPGVSCGASFSPSVLPMPKTASPPASGASPAIPTSTPSMMPRYTHPGSIGLHSSFAPPRVDNENGPRRSSSGTRRDPRPPEKGGGDGGPSPMPSHATTTTTTIGSSTASSVAAQPKTRQTIILGDIHEVSSSQKTEKRAAHPSPLPLPTSEAEKGVPSVFPRTLPKKDDRAEKRRSLFMQEMEGKS